MPHPRPGQNNPFAQLRAENAALKAELLKLKGHRSRSNLPSRLPDGAKVEAIYLAQREVWIGRLTINGREYTAEKKALFSLLTHLDRQYRQDIKQEG